MVTKFNNFQKVSFCLPFHQRIGTEILRECRKIWQFYNKMLNKRTFLKNINNNTLRISHLYSLNSHAESNSSFIWESVNNQKAIYLFRPTFLFSAAADDADRLCHDYFCIRLYKLVTCSQLTLTLVKKNHLKSFQFGLPKSVKYVFDRGTPYLRPFPISWLQLKSQKRVMKSIF